MPVIVVSAVGDLRHVHEAYRLGAKTFFIKPLAGEEQVLGAFARQHLSVKDSVAAEEGSIPRAEALRLPSPPPF